MKKKILSFSAIGLAVVLILTALVTLVLSVNFKGKVQPEASYSYLPKNMTFTAETLSEALEEGKTVDVKVKAEVLPEAATNKEVDWSVSWAEGATRSEEDVTDYVTVTPVVDGGLTATISCKKAFGEDKILVTVTTRDGGFSDTCTVNFLGLPVSITATCDVEKKTGTYGRGLEFNYWEVPTNGTSLDLTLTLAGPFDERTDAFYDDLVVTVTGPEISLTDGTTSLKNENAYASEILDYEITEDGLLKLSASSTIEGYEGFDGYVYADHLPALKVHVKCESSSAWTEFYVVPVVNVESVNLSQTEVVI
ncbi:MAG: hypothetical protein J6C93_07765 [Clostridia bacterium]|nr:hypothetical protein [Clostridia bacterium]